MIVRCAFATILILMRMVQPHKCQSSDDVDGVTVMHVALSSKEEKDDGAATVGGRKRRK